MAVDKLYGQQVWPADSVEIVSPADQTCAIASFRIRDKKSSDVADYLFREHQILTVGRALGTQGCVRVTPAVFTSGKEVQKFIEAVKKYVG